jgi:8-oxo-dGTP pyrophosphatase MutT (NUDIX family)
MLKINIGQQVLYLLPQKNIKELQAAGALGPILKWIEMPNLKESKDNKEETQTVEEIVQENSIEVAAKEIAKTKMLDIVEELESFSPTEGFKIAVVAYAKSYKKLVQLFKSFYKVQEAAGGLVRQQESGKILAIFRRGHWDMAKGKTEKNESIEQTAVREVQEETGIKNIDLQEFITTTYHTFNGQSVNAQSVNVRRRILKVSHWYNMQTPDVELVPQTEEDIEDIAWLDYADFLQKTPIFTNILDVLRLAATKFTQDDESAL